LFWSSDDDGGDIKIETNNNGPAVHGKGPVIIGPEYCLQSDGRRKKKAPFSHSDLTKQKRKRVRRIRLHEVTLNSI